MTISSATAYQTHGAAYGASQAVSLPTPTAPEMLHPNLARLAVNYDQIVARFQRGQLDQQAAISLIRKLRARDDQGVIWALNADGVWYRQTLDGRLERATPPTSGIPGVSPHQVSPHNYRSQNPDEFIGKPDSLTSAPNPFRRNRVASSDSRLRRFMAWPHRRLAVAAAALGVAGVLTLFSAFGSSASDSPTLPGSFESAPAVTLIVEP